MFHIQGSLFIGFTDTGAMHYSNLTQINISIQESIFEKCSRKNQPGGALFIQANDINVSMNKCCGFDCKTNTEYKSKDFGQLLFIIGNLGASNLNQISTLCCPEDSSLRRHGSICVSGHAQFRIKNFNSTKNKLSIGPSFCGYLINDVVVCHSIAVECHSLNEDLDRRYAAVSLHQEEDAEFTKINFINCSTKNKMIGKEVGTFTHCVFSNCINYNIDSFDKTTNIFGEPTESYDTIEKCNKVNTRTFEHFPIAHSIVSLCLFLYERHRILTQHCRNLA